MAHDGYPEQQSFAGQGMQGGNLQYPAAVSAETFPLQQPQQISPQQYHPYPGEVIYNIVPPYPQRHTAVVEVLSSLQQYYASSEPASSIPAAQTFVTSQYEPRYFPPQTPVMCPAITQEQQQIMPSLDNMDEAYNMYRHQLKAAFEAISSGRLAAASVEIMNLSRWLLTNVVKLGLHQDEHNPQFEPIQVGRDFNTCWLALGQKQKDLTEEAIRRRISDSNLLSAETIQAMVDELIRLCDLLEQHGLVDYDRGVWEEEITSIFSQCLDLLVP